MASTSSTIQGYEAFLGNLVGISSACKEEQESSSKDLSHICCLQQFKKVIDKGGRKGGRGVTCLIQTIDTVFFCWVSFIVALSFFTLKGWSYGVWYGSSHNLWRLNDQRSHECSAPTNSKLASWMVIGNANTACFHQRVVDIQRFE